MKIARKIIVAWAVLRTDGLREAARRLIVNVRSLLRRNAHVDECDIVAKCLEPTLHEGTMIDVGAHFGSALHEFAVAGWKVVARPRR